MGDASHETWGRILDATEAVMLAEGYAAVSSRRIAKQAGVTAAAVHFYFGTLEDLFVALVRRRGERERERYRSALDSDQPLHALWKVTNDRAGAQLLTELQALANHRKVLRAELVKWAEEFRQIEQDALAKVQRQWKLDGKSIEPIALVTLAAYLSRSLVVEEALGVTVGVAETRALIERTIESLEPS